MSIKKYKHKKTGIIYSRAQNHNYYTNGYELIPKYIVEDSKDWEEVIEKYLLITEDGVNLYRGDEFWHVDSYFGIGKGYLKENKFNPLEKYKHFSTEKAAKDYIDLNKPQYSKKDLLDSSINMQYGGWFIDALIKRINK